MAASDMGDRQDATHNHPPDDQQPDGLANQGPETRDDDFDP
jgi:hypothetical protein